MKLRLQGDSLRIRLSKPEVAELGAGRPLRSSTRFANGSIEVEVAPAGDALRAAYESNRILIAVPPEQAREWSGNEIEGLYATSGPCAIAIEKDYACLHRAGDENAGAFPNPAAAL